MSPADAPLPQLSKHADTLVRALPPEAITFEEWVQHVADRPEFDLAEDECRRALDWLVEHKLAGQLEAVDGEPDRWQVSDLGRAIQQAPFQGETAPASEVALDLQPGKVQAKAQG